MTDFLMTTIGRTSFLRVAETPHSRKRFTLTVSMSGQLQHMCRISCLKRRLVVLTATVGNLFQRQMPAG